MATTTQGRLAELPDIATRRQVSEYTQVSVPTLARWAMEGKGPRVTKFGALARYRKVDVLAWIAEQAQESAK